MINITKIGESFIANLPKIWNGWYLINGQKVDEEKINLLELPKSIVKVQKTNRLIFFRSSSSQITPEEHAERLKELRNKGSEHYDGWIFKDIEDEIRYKRFLNEWSAVYKDYLEETEEEWEIFEYPESKNKYIHSYRTIGRGLEPIFNYTPDPVQMLRDIAKEFGFQEVPDKTFEDVTKGKKFSLPNHSGIEYAKFNDKYLFTGNNKLGFFGITGTYQECETRFQSDWNKIYNKIKEVCVLLENDPLTDIKSAWVLKVLQNIKEKANKVDSTKKTCSVQHQLLKYIDDKLTEFVESYKNVQSNP